MSLSATRIADSAPARADHTTAARQASASVTTKPSLQFEAQNIIDAYETLREQCFKAARRDGGALMGTSQWLVKALRRNDIEMFATADGIECHGHAYTTQTMDNEWFAFTIPFTALTAEEGA